MCTVSDLCFRLCICFVYLFYVIVVVVVVVYFLLCKKLRYYKLLCSAVIMFVVDPDEWNVYCQRIVEYRIKER